MKTIFHSLTLSFVLLSLFFISSQNIVAQNSWELEKDKNGIQIFTQKLPNAPLKDYRAEATFNTTPEEFLAVLLDFDNYKNWFANTEKCYLIEKISDTEYLQYFEAKAPWPVSNRDCITRFKIDKKSNGDIRINLTLASEYYEDIAGVVHIPSFEGHWEITQISGGKIKVTQQVASDPGGAIPDWLANSFIVDTPFETFNALKKRF